MSGGHFDYKNDYACGEIFSWDVSPTYDLGSKEHRHYSEIARQLDPMQDVEMSDFIFDVFCLLHSFDWYYSGDIIKEQYQKDVEYFKKKWFKSDRSERLKEYVDSAVSDLHRRLLEMIGEKEA